MTLAREAALLLVLGIAMGVASVVWEPSLTATFAALGTRTGPPGARSAASATEQGDEAARAASAAIDPHARPIAALFLGNSFVHANAMPGMVADFAAADGQRPFVFVVDAPGGFSFEDHVAARRYQQHLASRKFDFVILQEQSQTLSFARKHRIRLSHAPARVLDDAIGYNHARTVLLMTWAREDGDRRGGVRGDTYAAMQARVAHGYDELRRELGSVLAPVGLVWERAHATRPGMPLWMHDGIHPTPAGSYLAAAVLYSVLYDRPVGPIDYDGPVGAADATFIRGLVDASADSLGIRGAIDAPWEAGRTGDGQPIPGIVPQQRGRCPAGYDPVDGVCYHHGMYRDPARRAQLIDAYKRGAMAPIVPE